MGFKHRFYQVLGGSFAALSLSMAPAWAEELQNWSFDTSRSELTFSLSDQVLPEFFLLSEPPRLVLDIPNTEIGNIEPDQLYGGAVQSIRVAQHTPDNVRVVIELSSDIVLLPDQADIQFNDGDDGQRHWHFRPLIADGENGEIATATTPVNPTEFRPSGGPDSGTDPDISLSAANLKLPVGRPSATALPIDPYDADAEPLNAVVSVPPLADDFSDEAMVSVPPLADDLPGSVATTPPASVVATADVPELPPMIVPELEAAEANDTAIPAATPTDANPRQVNLPELEAHAADAQSDEQVITESLASEPLSSAEIETPMPEEPMPEDSEMAVATEQDIAESEVTAAAAGSEPVVEVSTPTVSTPAGATETALAPVELFIPETPQVAVPDNGNNPISSPIQQPAAERTIVQTEVPSPLPFGQPLPTDR